MLTNCVKVQIRGSPLLVKRFIKEMKVYTLEGLAFEPQAVQDRDKCGSDPIIRSCRDPRRYEGLDHAQR